MLSPRSFTPSRDSYAAKMQPSHDASHDHHQHPTKKQRTLLDYFSLQQNTGPASQTQSTEQETLMHNTPAESNEQAPAGEQPDPILGGTVLPAELPPTLIIQPNTTVNSFARSRHRAQQRWCALLSSLALAVAWPPLSGITLNSSPRHTITTSSLLS